MSSNMVKIILLFFFFFLTSIHAFAIECRENYNLNLNEVYFEEFLPQRYAVDTKDNKNKNLSAQIEHFGEDTFLSIYGEEAHGVCLISKISIDPRKICPEGRWRLKGPSDAWSVISEKSVISDQAYIYDSSLCGGMTVDSSSNIISSSIHVTASMTGLGILIINSSFRNTKQIVTKSPPSRSASLISNSELFDFHHTGSIEADGLKLNNGKYLLEGDLRCDSQRCYYRQNPCPDGQNLYAFPNFSFLPDDTWWDASNYPMPTSGFACYESIPVLEDFSSDYRVFGYQDGVWNSQFSSALESYWPSPSIEYVGCTYDGVISKSLYRYDSIDPFYSLIPETEPAIVTTAFCTESMNTLQSSYSTKLAEIHRGSENLSPGYISIRGAPYCYKYKIIQFSPGRHRVVAHNLTAKYEECSDCAKGKIKVNGECLCPEGYVDIGGGCKKPVGCESQADYWKGLCACTKPYLNKDINGRESYSCSEPSRNASFKQATYLNNPELTAVFTDQPCRTVNGVMSYKFKIKLTKSYVSTADLAFFCTGKRGVVHSRPADYGYIASWFFGETEREIEHVLTPVGDCYEYKLRLQHRNSPNYYYWEKDIQLSYGECKTPEDK